MTNLRIDQPEAAEMRVPLSSPSSGDDNNGNVSANRESPPSTGHNLSESAMFERVRTDNGAMDSTSLMRTTSNISVSSTQAEPPTPGLRPITVPKRISKIPVDSYRDRRASMLPRQSSPLSISSDPQPLRHGRFASLNERPRKTGWPTPRQPSPIEDSEHSSDESPSAASPKAQSDTSPKRKSVSFSGIVTEISTKPLAEPSIHEPPAANEMSANVCSPTNKPSKQHGSRNKPELDSKPSQPNNEDRKATSILDDQITPTSVKSKAANEKVTDKPDKDAESHRAGVVESTTPQSTSTNDEQIKHQTDTQKAPDFAAAMKIITDLQSKVDSLAQEMDKMKGCLDEDHYELVECRHELDLVNSRYDVLFRVSEIIGMIVGFLFGSWIVRFLAEYGLAFDEAMDYMD